MSLETANFIHQLNPSYPAGSDRLAQGDDHLRLIKSVLKSTFPNLTGPLTVTDTFINELSKHLVPYGTIALFAGDTAPSGWVFCHGQTVNKSDGSGTVKVPDWRDATPFGASAEKPVGTKIGEWSKTYTTETAGAHTHAESKAKDAGNHTHGVAIQGTALTIDQIPAHKHGNGVVDKNDNLYNHGGFPADPPLGDSIDGNSSSGSREGYTTSVGGGKTHTHGVTENSTGAHAHELHITEAGGHGHQLTVATAQPSLAINFIMKI